MKNLIRFANFAENITYYKLFVFLERFFLKYSVVLFLLILMSFLSIKVVFILEKIFFQFICNFSPNIIFKMINFELDL